MKKRDMRPKETRQRPIASVPIGAWKCNFLPQDIMTDRRDGPTDHPINNTRKGRVKY